MTFDKLLNRYQTGMIVASEFIPEALSALSDESAKRILDSFPAEILSELASFVDGFDRNVPRIVIGGGQTPSVEQIDLARQWLHGGRVGVLAHRPT